MAPYLNFNIMNNKLHVKNALFKGVCSFACKQAARLIQATCLHTLWTVRRKPCPNCAVASSTSL